MFRFVGVFPSLSGAKAVATHLREYFAHPGQDFPGALKWGIDSVPPRSLAASLVAKGVARNIGNLGRQFIVGKNPEEAISELAKLRKQGLEFAVRFLG